ncbi:MAG: hypothetical protein Q4F74_07935, partial [Synergistaceae bacterium]|nr:hypothetical protein [Synergistaceae bacterium]
TAKFENGLPVEWEYRMLGELIHFDPTTKTKKANIYKIIPMEALNTEGFIINSDMISEADTLSGSRSINGDTLLARITPCLENGKTGVGQQNL